MSDKKMRKALGRGLSSLIPTVGDATPEGVAVTPVPIDEIRTNPFQPRTEFAQEEIQSLADSIRVQGLLQPILLRRSGDGYEIVSGERRLRALKLLGESTAPCIIRDRLSDREMQEMALVENIQRENLNEMEKACAYEKLLLEFGLSHDDLSQRVGASRSAVTNTLRLLKLPEKLQAMVRRQELSMGHARALLSIEDHARQEALAERVLKEGLSVREVEEASKKHSRSLLRKKPKTDIGNQYDPDTAAVVEKLQYKFGTAVKLCSKPDGGGTVEISYYSPEDLNRILDILL